ncbi:MAG: tRNA uridine(34) 5-carboxymethylaminomethyl modification radical SAM/GNAT enzyme Elp3 [Parcubacteria group bacterium]|nr:tRNA uridine(34) 5-carboxymethylaminomethyl modification radical SAM/GNAT enzyme Elp3 [Parcubacteria group bacterium]
MPLTYKKTHPQKVLDIIVRDLVAQYPKNSGDAEIIIRKSAGKYKFPSPAKSDILRTYRKMVHDTVIAADQRLENMLQKRAIRTSSGVAVVALLTKPFPCPGKCVYCPTAKNMPKSYLPDQPAVMRAVRNAWDPYRQVKSRITALHLNGHNTEKIELHITGGTWSFYPKQYQTWFIKRCFDAANSRFEMTDENAAKLHKIDKGKKNLIAAQKKNEYAKNRIIGMTIETRPDHITETEVKRLRDLGCTRIELGVQSVDDAVQKLTRREEDGSDAARATKLLRNAGFKIQYHMMPGLPGSTPEKDILGFKKIFSDADFKPDQLKIYPCVVVKDALLYRWWKQGNYRPYTDEELFETLLEIKKIVPQYVRIDRVFRDIPSKTVLAGNKILNLREYLQKELEKRGEKCRCMRCRQVGKEAANTQYSVHSTQREKIIMHEFEFEASGGKEFFISFENEFQTTLYSFLRLRLPRQEDIFISDLKHCALIRELHTYGKVQSIREKDSTSDSSQHRGLGKKLLRRAEAIAQKKGYEKIAVIAGIGSREYYKKLGYRLSGTYMVKGI